LPKVKNNIKDKKEKIVTENEIREDKLIQKSPKAPTKEPETMEELLALEKDKVRGLKKGEMVEGVVREVTGKSIFIDIGAKTDGVVLGKEYERNKDFIEKLQPGDKVTAYVGNTENDKGQILLSLRQAASSFAWKNFTDLMKE